MIELDPLQRAMVFFATTTLMAACGTEFAATGSTTTGTTTTTGDATTTTGDMTTSTSTGGGGATTSSTTTGAGGMGGVMPPACTPGDPTTCKAGSYCAEASITCKSCADPNDFSFAKPVALGISAPVPPLPIFPRIGHDGQLLFRFRSNQNSDIGFALPVQGAPMQWASPMPAPFVNSPKGDETGPLFLPNGDALISIVDGNINQNLPVFVFDSNASGQSTIYAINPGGQSLSQVKLKSKGTSYHVAIAHQASPPRFWYFSNFFSVADDTQLVTALGGQDPVKMPIALDNGCQASGDLMPWVTPDGRWMFFSATYPDAQSDCAAQDGAPSHLFYLALDQSGMPHNGAMAKAISPDEPTQELSPSLSPDLCTLYFSRIDRVSTVMYGAVRR